MDSNKIISPEYLFKSNYIEIQGSKIHYVDEGSGDPIIFLHGNPTSSYLWRNIIPHLKPHGRCIAPDLIGFGKSDKPDIEYRFFDHVKYIERFIEKLGLNNITFVIHDWGSALGFHYAMKNEINVKGLAFMEAIIRPVDWDDFPKEFKITFKMFRSKGLGWFMIGIMNMFVKQLLPKAIVRSLSEEEKRIYGQPFKTLKSRIPVWRWPNEIPIDGKPADVHKAVEEYSEKLKQSKLPKILFHATPGGIITAEGVEWCKSNLNNLTITDVGEGIHYLQEDHPHVIGENLVKWYKTL